MCCFECYDHYLFACVWIVNCWLQKRNRKQVHTYILKYTYAFFSDCSIQTRKRISFVIFCYDLGIFFSFTFLRKVHPGSHSSEIRSYSLFSSWMLNGTLHNLTLNHPFIDKKGSKKSQKLSCWCTKCSNRIQRYII